MTASTLSKSYLLMLKLRANVSLVIAIVILWCAPYTLTAVLTIHSRGPGLGPTAVGATLVVGLVLFHLFLAAATVNAAIENLQ